MNGERSCTTKIWPQLSWIESWNAGGSFTSMDLRDEPAISNWKRPCFPRQNGSEFPELAAQNFRNPHLKYVVPFINRPCTLKCEWWARLDSNQQPADYESD